MKICLKKRKGEKESTMKNKTNHQRINDHV